MSEMVERAARAICIARRWSPENWDLAEAEARAAIAALRTLPPEMLFTIAANRDAFDWEIEAVWEAVIDEALK